MSCPLCKGRFADLDSDIPNVRHVVCTNCWHTFGGLDTPEGFRIIMDVTGEVSYLEEHVWKPMYAKIEYELNKGRITIH